METDFKINIYYPESDVKKAISFYLLNIYGLKKYALITYPVLIVSIVVSVIINYHLLVFVFAFCGFMLRWIYYLRPIEGYLKFYKSRKGGLYSFDDEQIQISGEEIQSTCKWSVFKKAYETPLAFLLMDDNKFVYIFPKSCFNDASLIERMNKLLTAKFLDYKIYK